MTSRSHDPDRRLLLWSLGGALLALVAVWRRVLLGETDVARDALTFTGPAYEAVAAALRGGRLPEWWDAVGLGATLAGNPIHCAVHPLAWLLLPVPRVGADLFTFANVLLGGVGAGLLAGRLGADRRGAAIAALLFAGSGYVVSVVSTGMAPAIAWLPWLPWASDRLAAAGDVRERLRATLGLAAIGAMQLASGEPGHALAAGGLAIAAALGRPGARSWRTAGWLAGAAALALVLGAAAIFPALERLAVSARAEGVEPAVAGMWSLSPWRLAELVWPGALGRPLEEGRSLFPLVESVPPSYRHLGPAWAMSVFFGGTALLLAILGARRSGRSLLAWASLAFVVLALGARTPLFGLYRAAFPPAQLARFPEKYLSGAVALWAGLAGAGFTAALAAPAPAWPRRLGAGAAGAALLALLGVALSGPLGGAAERAPSIAGVETVRAIAAGGLVLAASLGLAAIASRQAARGRSRAAALAGLAAVGGPLLWDSTHQVLTAPRAVVEATPTALDAIRRSDPGAGRGPAGPRLIRSVGPGWDRVESGRDAAAETMELLSGNVAARFGFGVFPGADTAATAIADRFLLASQRMDGETLARLVGAPWAVAWAAPHEQLVSAPTHAIGQGWFLIRIEGARARAFVAPRWTRSGSPSEAIDALASSARAPDLGLVAVQGLEEAPRTGGDEPPSPCAVQARAPEEVELACSSPQGGIAVMLDELAPGWTATLDGRPAEAVRVDGIFRGVRVGPGSHRIGFRYEAPGLRAGLAVSACAWGALVAAWVALRRRREPAIAAGGRPG